MDTWSYELAPVLAAIRPAAKEFRAWAEARAGAKVAADCELALVEACNNLVMHAKARDVICVRVEVFEAEILVVIRDTTAGFEWPEKAELPDAEEDHGRGIFLMQALMTEVKYHRDDGWNELRLRRRV